MILRMIRLHFFKMSMNVIQQLVFVMVARERVSIFVEDTSARAQMVTFWHRMGKIAQVEKSVNNCDKA